MHQVRTHNPIAAQWMIDMQSLPGPMIKHTQFDDVDQNAIGTEIDLDDVQPSGAVNQGLSVWNHSFGFRVIAWSCEENVPVTVVPGDRNDSNLVGADGRRRSMIGLRFLVQAELIRRRLPNDSLPTRHTDSGQTRN
jgi:hypothetical protein